MQVNEANHTKEEEPQERKRSFWQRKKGWIIFFICLVILIAIGITIVVLRRRKGKGAVSTSNLCQEFQDQLRESREILTELKNDQAYLRRVHRASSVHSSRH